MATGSGKAYTVTSDPYLIFCRSSLSANTIGTDSLAHKHAIMHVCVWEHIVNLYYRTA